MYLLPLTVEWVPYCLFSLTLFRSGGYQIDWYRFPFICCMVFALNQSNHIGIGLKACLKIIKTFQLTLEQKDNRVHNLQNNEQLLLHWYILVKKLKKSINDEMTIPYNIVHYLCGLCKTSCLCHPCQWDIPRDIYQQDFC